MKKIQKEQFLILKEIDRVCRKNKIDYFLDGGTLLGAIRHKGFIPWDDDLDIAMTRKNFEKFKLHVNELGDRYFFQTFESDSYYGFPFAKVRKNGTRYIEEMSKDAKCHNGIFVDLFIYDDAVKSEYQSVFKKVLFYRMLLLVKNKYHLSNDTFIKKVEIIVLKILSLIISKKFITDKLNKLILSFYNRNDMDGYVQFSTPYFNKCFFDKDIFEKYIDVEFEGEKFKAPKKYDKMLSYLYGDYMTPPPKDKRHGIHGIIEIDYGKEK